MSVLSYEQDLLSDFLVAIGMPLARRMYVIGILWDEEATFEMMEYIVKNKEVDQNKIYDIACEIAARYREKIK